MIWNTIKTAVFLAMLSGLLMLIGSLIGGNSGVLFAFIFSLIMNGALYFWSDRMVLKMYNARPLDRAQFDWVYEIVAGLCQQMSMPMPKLYLINTPVANAFATGRSPSHSAVAVTAGLLDLLDRDELRGVLAHELSHIKNRDVLIATIAATMASAIGYVAYMLRYAAFWGNGRRDRESGNPFFMLIVAMLMPIAATLLQLAISRSREYQADESAASYSHDPLALASALEKLHAYVASAHPQHGDPRYASTSSLFIVYPFAQNGWLSLFMTHPPMSERIKRLRQQHEKMLRR